MTVPADLRWGYCGRCRRWILSNRWRRSKCPLCGKTVRVLEKADDSGYAVDFDAAEE